MCTGRRTGGGTGTDPGDQAETSAPFLAQRTIGDFRARRPETLTSIPAQM